MLSCLLIAAFACWEKANLLALLYVMISYVFVTSPYGVLVLDYTILIFAFFLALTGQGPIDLTAVTDSDQDLEAIFCVFSSGLILFVKVFILSSG